MKKYLYAVIAVIGLCSTWNTEAQRPALTSPVIRFFDQNGKPLVGGKLLSFQAGTTTPLATYADATTGAMNTNPVILDSTGSASVFLGPNVYKLVLQNSAGVVQWSADNIAQGMFAATYVTSYTGAQGTKRTGDIVAQTGDLTCAMVTDCPTLPTPPTLYYQTIKADGSAAVQEPILNFIAGVVGSVTSPTVTAGGSGYTGAPTVTFTGGTCDVEPTGSTNITSGAVSSLVITTAGSGCVTAPTVSLSGGGGSGATATVALQPNGISCVDDPANTSTDCTFTISGGSGGGGACTLTDQTSSRSLGGIYQNTTNSVMYVSGSATTHGSSVGTVFVMEGASSPTVTVFKDDATATLSGGGVGFFAAVLPGYYYSVTGTGAVYAVSDWAEVSGCGGGSGGGSSGTVNAGTTGQFATYPANGTSVSGHTLASADISGAGGLVNDPTSSQTAAQPAGTIFNVTGDPGALRLNNSPVCTYDGTTATNCPPGSQSSGPQYAIPAYNGSSVGGNYGLGTTSGSVDSTGEIFTYPSLTVTTQQDDPAVTGNTAAQLFSGTITDDGSSPFLAHSVASNQAMTATVDGDAFADWDANDTFNLNGFHANHYHPFQSRPNINGPGIIDEAFALTFQPTLTNTPHFNGGYGAVRCATTTGSYVMDTGVSACMLVSDTTLGYGMYDYASIHGSFSAHGYQSNDTSIDLDGAGTITTSGTVHGANVTSAGLVTGLNFNTNSGDVSANSYSGTNFFIAYASGNVFFGQNFSPFSGNTSISGYGMDSTYNPATGDYALSASTTSVTAGSAPTDIVNLYSFTPTGAGTGQLDLLVGASVGASPICTVANFNTCLTSAPAQTANTVYAGPCGGDASAPTFRFLCATDIPSLSGTYCTLAGCTFTGAVSSTTNGAASTPSFWLDAATYSGGTGTTTVPLGLIGTQSSTSWSTNGTYLGISYPSSFIGNALDIKQNGTSVFNVASGGAITFTSTIKGGSGFIGSGGAGGITITSTPSGTLPTLYVLANSSSNTGDLAQFANSGGTVASVAHDGTGAFHALTSGGSTVATLGAVQTFSSTNTFSASVNLNGGAFLGGSSISMTGGAVFTQAANNDLAGRLTLAATNTTSASYTFTKTYTTAPVCLAEPQNATAANVAALGAYSVQVSTTAVSITVVTAPSVDVSFGYHCIALN